MWNSTSNTQSIYSWISTFPAGFSSPLYECLWSAPPAYRLRCSASSFRCLEPLFTHPSSSSTITFTSQCSPCQLYQLITAFQPAYCFMCSMFRTLIWEKCFPTAAASTGFQFCSTSVPGFWLKCCTHLVSASSPWSFRRSWTQGTYFSNSGPCAPFPSGSSGFSRTTGTRPSSFSRMTGRCLNRACTFTWSPRSGRKFTKNLIFYFPQTPAISPQRSNPQFPSPSHIFSHLSPWPLPDRSRSKPFLAFLCLVPFPISPKNSYLSFIQLLSSPFYGIQPTDQVCLNSQKGWQ